MESTSGATFQTTACVILAMFLFAGVHTSTQHGYSGNVTDLPSIRLESQIENAIELAPRRELASGREEFRSRDRRGEILAIVKSELPSRFKSHAFAIARAVIVEANHHKLDPFLLLAVIKTESHFRIDMRGTQGEIGLMQVMPLTAKWLAPQAGFSARKRINLKDPATNIRIGATYLAALRKSFPGFGSRYIAAYNMGPTNVRRFIAQRIEPSMYPDRVLKNYNAFYAMITPSRKPAATPPAEQTRLDLHTIKSRIPMPSWVSS
jgi:soluble lytic murein transglycosylase-like protein